MQAGEAARERFTRLFAEHYWSVLGYLVRRDPDVHAARDAASEVFAIAWRKLADLPDDPLPWLFATARNVQANAHRAQRRRLRLTRKLAAQPSPPDGAGGEFGHVHAALARLSPADQEVMRLAAWEELTTAQIAQVLGCSTNAAGVRLHRARQRLRTAFEDVDRSEHMEDSTHER